MIRDSLYKVNYLENKYNWKERVAFQSIYIGDNEIHKNCSDNTKNDNLNELDLNKNCLKQDNYDYLFFIEGNSHTAQFVNPLNQINIIKNIYYKATHVDLISEQLVVNTSKKYKKIFYVTDIEHVNKLRKIINSKIFNLDNIEFILFNSTPFIYDHINPQYCLSRQINCYLSKKIDSNNRNLNKLNNELFKLEQANSKIHIFDSYQALCPLYQCKIYDKSRDILYFTDRTHLSPEGSMSLKDNLKDFLINKVKFKN
tara:strand:- start:12 stop:779 length:768 start_codon:yes stop_codon:yes gene_type:complete